MNSTEIEILEGNLLIAKFMGLAEDEYPSGLPKGTDIWGNFMDNDIQYHSSWSWLMPVVEKIETIDNCSYFLHTDPWGIDIYEYFSGNEEIIVSIDKDEKSKIDLYYSTVIEFIKWYKRHGK